MTHTASHPTTSSPVESDRAYPCAVRLARDAQSGWAATPLNERLSVLRRFRHALADDPQPWAEAIKVDRQRTIADSLAAEVLPLADACRFLERNAARILRDQKPSRRDRPIWGRGLKVRIRREPCGVVLVIAPSNYPLFLAGVQVLQAITAGNAAIVKPAPTTSAPMQQLTVALEQAGAPAGLVHVLEESPAAAQRALQQRVDHVVLTGSAATGRAVLRQTAETLTPCTMELSGCDAVFVLPGADLDRVTACLGFGLRLNGGATCIGPRRVFVQRDQLRGLIDRLRELLPAIPPTTLPAAIADRAEELVSGAIAEGASFISSSSPSFAPESFAPVVLQTNDLDAPLYKADLFASVMSLIEVNSPEQALQLDMQCPYALGAGVFGPTREAEEFAERINAGSVTVNDLVAPTADPRVPFGGRGESGFGVTRGAEGLLELTRAKAIVTQTARWLPHLDPPRDGLDQLVTGLIRAAHGKTLADRWRGIREVISSARK